MAISFSRQLKRTLFRDLGPACIPDPEDHRPALATSTDAGR
jgi:hypothetical protein